MLLRRGRVHRVLRRLCRRPGHLVHFDGASRLAERVLGHASVAADVARSKVLYFEPHLALVRARAAFDDNAVVLRVAYNDLAVVACPVRHGVRVRLEIAFQRNVSANRSSYELFGRPDQRRNWTKITIISATVVA